MASMNRNVNLEEVNTDAFMGISYLNYQSMLQKVVFIGGIVWLHRGDKRAGALGIEL